MSSDPQPDPASPLLAARGVAAAYGPMQVLWGIDLDIAPRETVLLLGANGAGKTTALKVLVGLLAAKAGTVRFDGADITRTRTDKRMRAGMAYMSELGVFPDLTIAENIRVGARSASRKEAKERAEELYALFPVLKDKQRQAASSLSGGQRKMLGIAKALASAPKLLVMDEPSAGLSPLFVGEVLRALSALREKGLSLLVAEQNIGFLDIADRVSVLEGGHIRFTGSVAAMNDDADLRKAYFGLK